MFEKDFMIGLLRHYFAPLSSPNGCFFFDFRLKKNATFPDKRLRFYNFAQATVVMAPDTRRREMQRQVDILGCHTQFQINSDKCNECQWTCKADTFRHGRSEEKEK